MKKTKLSTLHGLELRIIGLISDMAEDTETQLTEEIKKLKLFALQLDESTDIQKSSVYTRY
jgi:hypothetical protein